MHGRRSNPRHGGRSSLVAIFACSCALLLFLWFFVGRGAGGREPSEIRAAQSGRAQEPHSLDPAGRAPAELLEPEVPEPAERAQSEVASLPPEVVAPASIIGRLIVDDAPPGSGRLVLRTSDGSWEKTVAFGDDGSFWIEDVPAAKLQGSFELEPRNGRWLLLPRVEFEARSGWTESMDLAWKTRQVNLRVTGPDSTGGPATITLDGADYDTSVDTDALGKVRLRLVGDGPFTFRAVRRDGAEGTASVDLAESDDLETVLISTTAPEDR